MKKITALTVIFMLAAVICGCGSKAGSAASGTVISLDEEDDLIDGIIISGEDETYDTEQTLICVYICGEINSPGVYELEEGSRIYQLVEAAGGMTDSADESAVNLAGLLTDGDMVDIPSITDESDASASSSSGITSDGKVNINTATADELMTLSGIGEARAADIIAYREENGSFSTADEIMNVSGIGEGIYEKIKDDICV